ncbi:Uncharacterised protein [Streptococcus pneumoniae]|nr:Uncharacterised protein [Streptococcus pneumoniae]
MKLTKSFQIELTKSANIYYGKAKADVVKRFSNSINYYALQTSVEVIYYR